MNAATYPSMPGFKVEGASRDAAADIADHAQTVRDRVDALFDAYAGLTSDECAEKLGEDILTVRPRLSELKRMRRIEDTDERRTNKSGMTATVLRRAATKVWKDELF